VESQAMWVILMKEIWSWVLWDFGIKETSFEREKTKRPQKK